MSERAGLPMVDVFISYSRSDLATVTRLARAVEAAGYEVWWDAELPPHQSYGDVITAKIEQTRAAIVVWSQSAVKSEWVRAEADMARHHRKLIQTAIDDVMPPLPFNQIQYAKIGDWQGEPDHTGWRKVLVSLADLCGPRGDGAVPPRPIPISPTPVPPVQEIRPPQPVPLAAPTASRWPLYAGIGIAAVGLAAAGGLLLGRQEAVPAPAPAAMPAPAATPAAAQAAAVAQEPATGGDAPLVAAGAADEPAVATEEGPAPRPNDGDMTFADSSTRVLTAAEVAALGPATLKIARNEIFARKGMRFKTPFLRDWFSRYAWYRPRFDRVPLNPTERANVELIRQAEARFGG